jgi:hypothetical protein
MAFFDKLFNKQAAPAAEAPPMTSREANELLVKAVSAGDLKTAERALKATGSPNLDAQGFYWASNDHGRWQVPERQPMLWFAVDRNNLPMAELLIKHGADMTRRHRGVPPLYRAVVEGQTPMVKMLLEAGAPLEPVFDKSYLRLAQEQQYADVTKLLMDEPQRRRDAAEAQRQAAAHAEAQRIADAEAAKHAAENPQPVTDQSVAVMKPLSFKGPKKRGLFK